MLVLLHIPKTTENDPTIIVSVNNANVIAPDVLATNGVIHVITDDVLVPPSSLSYLKAVVMKLPIN
jgi:uncharacterized surface protein with fasciclin (FAS1) repeats